MDRKTNRIAGGSSINPGDENGYADMIVWTDTTIYVYEMKHAGGPAEASGRRQALNYVDHLEKQLREQDPNDRRRVELGPNLPFSQIIDSTARPNGKFVGFLEAADPWRRVVQEMERRRR